MARIITLANQKGGVGKTTTTLNLGAALAARGRRVLLIDGDPQSNLTEGLGLDPYAQERTTYDVFQTPRQAAGAIQTITLPAEGAHATLQFDLIAATPDMAVLDLELVSQMRREEKLRTALGPIRERYDYILIDAPPSLGLLTINLFAAADGLLVPLQVHIYALRGLALLQRTVDLVREINPDLRVIGVVCTMTDSRNRLSRTVEETVRAELGDLVLTTTIPQNIRLAEAPASGQPILRYAATSAGAVAYAALAEEVDRAR